MKKDDPAQKTPKRRARRGSASAVKLSDVARHAGVSTASVSRAINEPAKISPGLRALIMRSVEELGWIPNAAGRALASLRTRTIGAVLPTLDHPNFASEIEALQTSLSAANYTLLFSCSNWDEDRAYEQARHMIERGVDGVVLHGEVQSPKLWKLLEEQQLPAVMINAMRPVTQCPCVGYDAAAAFRRATQHLLDLGHRRFGLMVLTTEASENAGIQDLDPRAEPRVAGVLEALRERNLTVLPQHRTQTSWSFSKGRQNFRQIMSGPDRPTAIICLNDYLAIGAILESRTMRLRTPEDVSIIGFDDLEISSQIDPPLTTLHVPERQMGRAAARILMSMLRTGGQSHPESVELPVDLVLRGSTGPVPRSTRSP